MRGEFDEARAADPRGRTRSWPSSTGCSPPSRTTRRWSRRSPATPAAAEALLRAGYERLEEMGEKAILATTAALLAQALYAQERYDEAARFCTVSETTAPAEDSSTQVIWRGVRAKLLARERRGRRRPRRSPARRFGSCRRRTS